jgi:nitroreductase
VIDPADLAELIAARKSVRGFRPEPLPRATLSALFAAAQRAASWCNIQPWRAVVTEPPRTAAVAAALLAAAESEAPAPELPFPVEYPQPYLGHRRACGFGLYETMGIAAGDHDARRAAGRRNFALFDAPHLAVVTVDKRLSDYALIDIGVWLGVVLTQATAMGIATCPMASIANFPSALRASLPIPDDVRILFGLALGHEDPTVPANRFRSERAPIDANVTFVERD